MTNLPDDPRLALMLLSSMIEPGDAELDDLLGEIGPIEVVKRLWEGEVPERLQRITSAIVSCTHDPAARAADIAAATEECGARVLIPGDPDWPDQLRDLLLVCDADEPHVRPPRCLWVRGEQDLDRLCRRSVAIVGARAATEYGQHLADDLAAELTEAGWTIVSGGAFGIDRAAHLGALARGGSTVSVLACGVELPYPKGNHSMFNLIAERGLIVSEWPPGTTVMKHRFLTRNRVIAALTAGTVVIEAAHRSGARNTARYAAELGRVLMFTPGPVTSSMSAGAHQLAREPWEARLVTRAEEVIEDLTGIGGPLATPPPPQRRPFDRLTEIEARLVESLPRGYVVETTRLAAAAGVPADIAAETLDRLLQTGWVDRIDNRWRLSRGSHS
ncbi:DNA-processing protein DprA [Glycomyces algeriensis]|uniref:DNA processing protein DprA n=1 Tax=Glycomyces algeriensis TaxID=256037 RepID=A0A9W6G8R0_9ACTN|nr:DNA-processing protein DprA [Glycomyces algeriensis]MDA1365297.1 DNA-processing protein DprA [Glycomyces algeriensis]MDR7349639.1 DNA processing protein [Glycomyces algeriensis]GLI42347.1 putative DNA processing protein DprA [Glycomyces algeriensis]